MRQGIARCGHVLVVQWRKRISENYVSELELGQKEVCLRTIGVLSKALGVAIEDIVKGL